MVQRNMVNTRGLEIKDRKLSGNYKIGGRKGKGEEGRKKRREVRKRKHGRRQEGRGGKRMEKGRKN